MIKIIIYSLVGLFFVLLQTAVLPKFLPFEFKPDLLLVLVVYLGLNEKCLRGSLLAYFLGCVGDVFAGHYLGLYGLSFLVVYLVVRWAAGRLNAESSLLFFFLVFCGTFVHGGILFFSLGFFAEAGPVFPLFAKYILPQALLNLAAALFMLIVAAALLNHFSPRLDIPGMRLVSRRYEY